MFELRTFIGVRVAICEDILHVMRTVDRFGLVGYSIRAKHESDGLDEFSDLISGRL